MIVFRDIFYCDSRFIGVCYLLFSIFGGFVGFSFSCFLRLELSVPFSLFNENLYYISITTHGVVMVFFLLTTLGSSFSNYFLPGILGLEDMFLPRLNVFGFMLLFPSFFLVVVSLLITEGVQAGWTLYVPLSSGLFSNGLALDLFILAVHIFSLSSLLGSINIFLSVYYSLHRFGSVLDLSSFTWGYLVTSFLVLFTTPSLSCVLTMLLFDRCFGTFYFNSDFGGDSLLYQTMFWFWGHPEVYILVLPVFSVVSFVLSIHSKGVLYNSEGIIFSMVSLGVLSCLVWGHHMVTVGWSLESRGFFMSSTVIISIPTGVKIFSWLFNLFLCFEGCSVSLSCVVFFLVLFSFGGVTGIFLSNTSLDLVFHDSYFVVGHFHFVLSIASFFGFVSGLFEVLRSMLNVGGFSMGVSCFLISVIFSLAMSLSSFFFFLHMLGMQGYPRRVSCYCLEVYSFFYISSVFFLVSFLIIVFMSIFFLFLFIGNGSDKRVGCFIKIKVEFDAVEFLEFILRIYDESWVLFLFFSLEGNVSMRGVYLLVFSIFLNVICGLCCKFYLFSCGYFVFYLFITLGLLLLSVSSYFEVFDRSDNKGFILFLVLVLLFDCLFSFGFSFYLFNFLFNPVYLFEGDRLFSIYILFKHMGTFVFYISLFSFFSVLFFFIFLFLLF